MSAILKPLHPDQAPVVEELRALYSHAEVLTLALALPFRRVAAEAVWPKFRFVAQGVDDRDLSPPEGRVAEEIKKATFEALVVYVAAASRHGIARVLTRLKHAKEAELAALQQANDVLSTANNRKAVHLKRSLKGEPIVGGSESSG